MFIYYFIIKDCKAYKWLEMLVKYIISMFYISCGGFKKIGTRIVIKPTKLSTNIVAY